MASVQSELLRIGTLIAAQEQVLVSRFGSPEMQLRWANTEHFLPGLAIVATFADVEHIRLSAIDCIQFSLLSNADGDEALRVFADPAQAENYEDQYGLYFLQQFQRYENRPDSFMPVGLSSVEQELAIAEERQLILPEYFD